MVLIGLGLTVLQPLILLLITFSLGYFYIDFTTVTVGNLWDIIWISSLIWFGIAVVVITIAFRMGLVENNNGVNGSFVSLTVMIMFWVVAYFKGLFPYTLSALSFAILWEVIWIAILIVIAIYVIIYIASFFVKMR